jgi:hypothetical protein
VAELQAAIGQQIERQIAHWVQAAGRLSLDDLAAPPAWGQLERYLGLAARGHLQRVIDRLHADARALVAAHRAARDPASLRSQLLAFQHRYLRAETTLDFFADAINVRTNATVGALLRACDTLAHRAMSQLLERIGQPVPVALTYLDKGRGASILKAGLRLWDGGDTCPVAVIKVTHHNLLRTTALIHEAGHQVAHIAHWNGELAAALGDALRAPAGAEVADTWAGWASEIAADGFAFATTGFAAVAALHDVLAADPPLAFRFVPGDPHPVSYLRVLLGVQMCRRCYGEGPWDALGAAWQALHPSSLAPAEVQPLVRASLPLLDRVAAVCLDAPMRAFGGRSLASLLPPARVSPAALTEMAARLGPALYTSAHWLWSEPLRILALTGLRLAETPRDFQPILELQRQSMLRLGGALQTT